MDRVPEVDYLATSRRPPFSTLPAAVHEAVGRVGGAQVRRAHAPVGSGFGGAFAGLVDLADGSRVFVKAAGPTTPHIVRALAREADILPRLTSLLCPPRVVGSAGVEAEGGVWEVLVLEAVRGTQPGAPWTAADADAAHDACLEIAGASLEPLDDLGLVAAEDDLAGAAGAVPALEALAGGDRRWPERHVVPTPAAAAEMARLAATVGDAVRGGSLVHLDVRPDNLLLEPEGLMRVLDWNQAVVGAPWVDLVSLWPLQHHHGVDVHRFSGSPLLAGVDDDTVDAVLAFLVGFMVDGADSPPPPGCTEALRAHTVFFSDTTVRLLAARRGWRLGPPG